MELLLLDAAGNSAPLIRYSCSAQRCCFDGAGAACFDVGRAPTGAWRVIGRLAGSAQVTCHRRVKWPSDVARYVPHHTSRRELKPAV